jgi:hypothetical protein
MRTTIVPAQITTIEDRIAGRLGLSQLLLLIAPIFGGSGIFVILPPFFDYAVYKVVLIVCFTVLSGLLAIRIKGKILLVWCVVLLRYNLRPRYYVFSKNSLHARAVEKPVVEEEAAEELRPQKVAPIRLRQLSTAELVQVEKIISNPAVNLRFVTNKKGVLSVRLTEVQQESLSPSAN